MARPYISVAVRRLVVERAKARCEYCQSWAEFATQAFDVDHIVPISQDGPSTAENLAYACSGCNRHKYDHVTAVDPVDGSDVPLFHPRQMQWQEHFGWSEDYTLLIGLTSIGRATIDSLRLNRSGVVNLRKLLKLAGKHPPFLE